MAKGASKGGVHRRSFLKGVTAAGAAAVGTTLVGTGAALGEMAAPREAPRSTSPLPASAMMIERPGSDFMVDVLKALGT